VVRAREEYWRKWGQIPLTDELDERAFVDVCWVVYPDLDDFTTEGLTMRTVLLDHISAEEPLPDDLRFFVDSRGLSLFELLVNKLYGGREELARRKTAMASRVAAIRSSEGRRNQYTAEAFAAIQVLTALRARAIGIDIFVNTMRRDMEEKVLALPGGEYYDHIRTEDVLGMQKGGLRLNRTDPYVLDHLYRYLGYFTNTRDFVDLIRKLMSQGKIEKNSLWEIGVDPDRLELLKPIDLTRFIPLVLHEGLITPFLSGGELRELIRTRVGDGPISCTMTTDQRLRVGMEILENSVSARSN